MEIPAALVTAFPLSRDGLFNRVARDTDDAMLAVIARADYGIGADEALAELQAVRDSGVLPARLSGLAWEVLGLTRFADPDAPNAPPFDPGPSGSAGHQARLFAGALLLWLDADAATRVDPRYPIIPTLDDATLAQSLVSAGVLGPTSSEPLATFLTWWLTGQSPPGLRCLLPALGLLILALRLRAHRFDEATLGEFAAWVLTLEKPDYADLPGRPDLPRPQPFGVQSGFWVPLMAELAAGAATLEAEEARTIVQLCGLLIDPEG